MSNSLAAAQLQFQKCLWQDMKTATPCRPQDITKEVSMIADDSSTDLRLVNNVSQTICLKGVFRTSATVTPLALTIILSVRKFLSVVEPWLP